MAGLNEEIYECNSIIEDRCSLVDEGYWYENDLLLAAELGKTLLERNRDLETQLSLQTKNSISLRMEIDLLKKQLETLRELNRNKMILYEDVDKNSHDLEITNRNLLSENKKQKEKIHNLTKKNSYLEQNLEDHSIKLCATEKEIEELKKHIYHQQSNSQNCIERIPSVELSKYENSVDILPKNPVISCKKCKEKKEKINFLEIELDLKNQENEDLILQISDLHKKLRYTEVELEDLKCLPVQSNEKQNHNTLVEDLYSVMEYDIDRVDEKPVEVGSLNTGGKVFTSTNSMKSIGAEKTKNNKSPSLLTELDEKYSNLVKQYENLLSSSRNREELCNKCSSTSYCEEDFQKKLNNIFSEETRRQRKLLITNDYRPKYKELFRDAFDILKDMKQKKRSKEIGNVIPIKREDRLNVLE